MKITKCDRRSPTGTQLKPNPLVCFLRQPKYSEHWNAAEDNNVELYWSKDLEHETKMGKEKKEEKEEAEKEKKTKREGNLY